MGLNGPSGKWASDKRSSPSSEQNSLHLPTSWVFFSTIPSWIYLSDINTHEGCVPSPNQIVRGLDQPVYCGRRVVERETSPFWYLMAESLISLPDPTSRYLSTLRLPLSLTLKNLAAFSFVALKRLVYIQRSRKRNEDALRQWRMCHHHSYCNF